ncbi:MAG: Ig-like domain-containing protein [Gemmataceae bacterium]|nr:Ig-like domain-containing protein [Gemmataceae bacterium]
MTFASRTGTFTTGSGFSLGDGLFLRAVYNPNDVTLVCYSNASPINVSPVTVSVTEGGATAQYAVTLTGTTVPGGDVVVNIAPDVQIEVSAPALTFTPANWALPQLVTVTAVDDAALEGNHTGVITHTSTSTVPAFNNATIASVTAQIADNNDVPSPSTPDLEAGSDSGSSSTDNITNVATPTFSGTAVPGSTIELFDGAASLGTAVADSGAGAWTFTTAALGDGSHTITATATVGGFASAPSAALVVVIDKIAPTISASPSIAPNANGWNNTDVTVSYSFADDAGGSGVDAAASDTADDLLTTSRTASGTVVDLAGNSATTSYSALIDKVAPTISASPSVGANANGWNNSDVTVTYTFSDDADGSGVDAAASDTADDLLTASGTASGTVVDLAGNTATVSYSALIDKVAPTVVAQRDTPANANGWNNTDVDASFTAHDDLSGFGPGAGVLDAAGSHTFTSEGAGQSHTFTVTDLAGNAASASVGDVNIDKTAPAISAQRDTAANVNGWNNTDVDASFTATDDLSGFGPGPGVLDAAGAFTFTSEGVAQSRTFTVHDLAGNSSSATIDDVNIDKTAPTINAQRDTPANANGWNNTDVAASFTASDNLSGFGPGAGVLSSSGSFTFTQEGANQSHTFGVIDLAGNAASATVGGVNIDKTAPAPPAITSPADGTTTSDTTLTVAGTAEANALVTVFANGSPLGITAANGAGSWSLTTPTLTPGSYSFTATATDIADNASAPSAAVDVIVQDDGSDPFPPGSVTLTADGTLMIVGTDCRDIVRVQELGDDAIVVRAKFGWPPYNSCDDEGSDSCGDEADDAYGDWTDDACAEDDCVRERFHGTFAAGAVERIVILGRGGDDNLMVAHPITVPALIDGGAGDDKIRGGGGDDVVFAGSGDDRVHGRFGNDVLVGGDGSDVLIGGHGRDLMIGGFGCDRLEGNGDDDLLIAGVVSFENDAAALAAVMAEWTSCHSYAARVANLSGQGSSDRFNGDVFLIGDGPGATVHDDGAQDRLSGDKGRDWFFANLDCGVRDCLTDLKNNETAVDIDVE